MQLRIPGPTPCPPEVLKAASKQMINHRGEEFAQLIFRITNRLKEIFLTKNDMFLLTCSGTGGMEAAIVNTLSPDDEVLVLSNGFFGDRFAEIVHVYGVRVKKIDFPWGKPIDPGAVKKTLHQDGQIKAVIMVHNETSTGLTNPLSEIAPIVKEHDKLLIVDSISGLGAIEFRTDEWGVDVAVAGSQKSWMAPPGVAMLSFSPQAWKAYQKSKLPKYYLDLKRAKSFLEKGQTPWTPALSVFYALEASLDLMMKEGLPNIWKRHEQVAEKARQGIASLGLSLFPERAFASNTITAINSNGFEVGKLLKLLKEERNIILAGGQDRLKGKIFRIGHLGMVTEKDIEEVITGIKEVLPRVSHG